MDSSPLEFANGGLPRRKFLGLLLSAAGLAFFPWGCGGGASPLPFQPKILSTTEAQTLLALRQAVFSKAALASEKGGAKWFLQEVEDLLSLNPPYLVSDLKLALGVVRRAPLWRLSFRPLETLLAPKAADSFQRLLTTKILGPKQAAEGVLQLINFVHYGNSGTWAAMGYEGTWVKK